MVATKAEDGLLAAAADATEGELAATATHAAATKD